MAKKYYGSKNKGFGMDKSSPANMPQNVVNKTYPKMDYAMTEGRYRDDISGIDGLGKKNASKVRSQMIKD